jgi:hypothetical protein
VVDPRLGAFANGSFAQVIELPYLGGAHAAAVPDQPEASDRPAGAGSSKVQQKLGRGVIENKHSTRC